MTTWKCILGLVIGIQFSIQGFTITQLACGDSHSMALTKEGYVFAWGEASFGQLGLDDIRELPKNNEHKPY